jgi:hypothetical protein
MHPSFQKSKLVYRGSEDGYSNDNYHGQCDYIGPTLMIAKSEHNKIFGGFTDIS